MRAWRLKMGYTQTELGELIGHCVFHVNAQERGAHSIAKHTLLHVALLYAIQSLPPDAPVSILQDMLTPQSVLDRRAKAQARLAQRQAKRSKTSKRKPTKRSNPRRSNPSKP